MLFPIQDDDDAIWAELDCQKIERVLQSIIIVLITTLLIMPVFAEFFDRIAGEQKPLDWIVGMLCSGGIGVIIVMCVYEIAERYRDHDE